MNDTVNQLTVPVLSLPGQVVFPGSVATVAVAEHGTSEPIAAARAGDGRLVIVPELDGRVPTIGVLATVEQVGETPRGEQAAIVRAVSRVRLVAETTSERAGRFMVVEPVVDPRPTPRVEALGRELREVVAMIAERRNSRRLPEILRSAHEPGALADAVTAWSEAPVDHRVTVLELTDVGARVDMVLTWAKQHLAELEVSAKIRADVTEGMEATQREFLLRQQLAAIRKELGEDDPASDDYRARLDALGASVPAKVREAVERELTRLERTSGQSPEQSWIRTWLDRVLEMPWGERTTDTHDIAAARSILDADHTGLDDVKQRIIEFLSVRKLRAERGVASADGRGNGAIVALVGPPGVGKTSLGESIARAMGRTFTRVALGGVRDEAEIRGHRRTYVGAQPGRIVRALGEAGSMNPVVLLDEIDKLSSGGWSGDPTAALLEVLDPAQNHTFRDHYLEVELDLSDVVFIATANVLDSIPGPLLDRLEVVRLDGYTTAEKVAIARDHLLARQVERAGLRVDEVDVDEVTLTTLVEGWTREAGVRSLERELGSLVRKLAARVAEGFDTPIMVRPDDLTTYLRRPRFNDEVADRVHGPGVATGLAVTGVGGDVLFIESTAFDGEPSLTLTGQLGDVMKESAHIALSWVRAHSRELGIDSAALSRRFHVHVPAGAVPKDGPSAGVTMTTALVSLLTGRPVRREVGMTGEITLQGRVLPIGGVKQKVLAAHRAGLTEVVLPKRNGPDLDDVPDKVREQMTFHLAESLDEVLAVALG